MRRYVAYIYLNKLRTEVSVEARNEFDAEKMIRAQYNVHGKILVSPDYKYEHAIRDQENKKRRERYPSENVDKFLDQSDQQAIDQKNRFENKWQEHLKSEAKKIERQGGIRDKEYSFGSGETHIPNKPKGEEPKGFFSWLFSPKSKGPQKVEPEDYDLMCMIRRRWEPHIVKFSEIQCRIRATPSGKVYMFGECNNLSEAINWVKIISSTPNVSEVNGKINYLVNDVDSSKDYKYEHAIRDQENRKRHEENRKHRASEAVVENYREETKNEEGFIEAIGSLVAIVFVLWGISYFFSDVREINKSKAEQEKLGSIVLSPQSDEELRDWKKTTREKEIKDKKKQAEDRKKFDEDSEAKLKQEHIQAGKELQKACLDAGGKHEYCDRSLCYYTRDFFPCNTLPPYWDGISPWVAPTNEASPTEKKGSRKNSKPKKPATNQDINLLDIFQ